MGVGSEIQKNRPCVVIQNDIGYIRSSVITVIPISHTCKQHLNCFVQIAEKHDADNNIILNGAAKELLCIDNNKIVVEELKKILDKH